MLEMIKPRKKIVSHRRKFDHKMRMLHADTKELQKAHKFKLEVSPSCWTNIALWVNQQDCLRFNMNRINLSVCLIRRGLQSFSSQLEQVLLLQIGKAVSLCPDGPSL